MAGSKEISWQPVGENVEYANVDGYVMLRMKTDVKGTPSKSQKNIVLASTRGNTTLPNGVKLGLNCFTSPPPPAVE